MGQWDSHFCSPRCRAGLPPSLLEPLLALDGRDVPVSFPCTSRNPHTWPLEGCSGYKAVGLSCLARLLSSPRTEVRSAPSLVTITMLAAYTPGASTLCQAFLRRLLLWSACDLCLLPQS